MLITSSKFLSKSIETTSFSLTPLSTKYLASLFALSFNSLYVIFLSSNITAMFSGVFSTCSSNKSTIVLLCGYSILVLLNSFNILFFSSFVTTSISFNKISSLLII